MMIAGLYFWARGGLSTKNVDNAVNIVNKKAEINQF